MTREMDLRSGEGGHGSQPRGVSGNSVISRDRIGERGESGSSAAPVDLGGEREEALGVRVSESH